MSQISISSILIFLFIVAAVGFQVYCLLAYRWPTIPRRVRAGDP